MRKVLFTATVDSHIMQFHLPYLKWFKEQGYEVHVATNGKKEIPYCDVKHVVSFERNPIKLNNLKAIKQLKKIIEEEKFNIIHCHTPMGSVDTRIAARKARKKYGTKVIYTAHGFHFYKGAPIINWLLFYPIEKICARWTDCLITISEEDFELAKRKIKAKKIEHIYGIGMNTKRFENEISEIEKEKKRKEFQINKDDIVFSYVAELNKNKNQILLINTIKELKKEMQNIKLLLIGDGSFLEKYENIIKSEHLENNVKLLGRRSDINEILSITDIYLASSLREGLSVNIIEAMYKGLPIIATDNRGHRELVKTGINGFIINNKTLECLKQIKTLIGDETKRQKFGKNSRKMVNKFLLENVIKEISIIYSDLLKTRR